MWWLLLAGGALLLLSSSSSSGTPPASSTDTDTSDDPTSGTGPDKAMDTSPIDRGLLLRSDAAASWIRMQAAAAQDGVQLSPDAGARVALRTQADEDAMRAEGYCTVAPGKLSDHVRGVALDCNEDGAHDNAWLSQHAGDYGWSFPVASERWHGVYNPENDTFASSSNAD